MIGNRSFENVANLKYLRTRVINNNLIQEEIKNRFSSGNACYHSVQNPLSYRLLSKNVKINYRTIILLVLFYGCETSFLTLKEEHRLRAFENRVLRRIFAPKRDEIIGGWGRQNNKELHNLHSSLNIIRMIKSRKMKLAGHI
jgi:hypothetical protein